MLGSLLFAQTSPMRKVLLGFTRGLVCNPFRLLSIWIKNFPAGNIASYFVKKHHWCYLRSYTEYKEAFSNPDEHDFQKNILVLFSLLY